MSCHPGIDEELARLRAENRLLRDKLNERDEKRRLLEENEAMKKERKDGEISPPSR